MYSTCSSNLIKTVHPRRVSSEHTQHRHRLQDSMYGTRDQCVGESGFRQKQSAVCARENKQETTHSNYKPKLLEASISGTVDYRDTTGRSQKDHKDNDVWLCQIDVVRPQLIHLLWYCVSQCARYWHRYSATEPTACMLARCPPRV